MIQLTSAQLDAWIAMLIYPVARILSLLMAAPPFSNLALPTRVRLIVGLTIGIAVAPTLPPIRGFSPASEIGLLVLVEQLLIGFAMGFMLRLIFTAIDLAGMLISNQAGLGFATAYDPQNTSQTPVISEFLGILALLSFLSINGHLMTLSVLAQSFNTLPVGLLSFSADSWRNLANAGVVIFSSGVFLALPIIVTLLIGNMAIAILGRIAPQLNLMVIGFPITIIVTFLALIVSLSYLATPLQELFEYGLQSMTGMLLTR